MRLYPVTRIGWITFNISLPSTVPESYRLSRSRRLYNVLYDMLRDSPLNCRFGIVAPGESLICETQHRMCSFSAI